MTNGKSLKRALLSSAFSLIICVAMLIGTTFAWFTDTASTAVNKIQAGNLKVDIVDQNGNSLNGKSLSFRDVNNKTDILWEPGAKFNLDSFKIVNKGNLALKYKVIISGINGSAKLLEAIDFTVKIGDAAEAALADWEGVLLPDGAAAADTMPVKETKLITISGKMREDAGNEYQGLSIGGIGITVLATQYTYENDSIGNTYDREAAYKGTQEFTSGTHTLGNGGIALDPNGVAVSVSGEGTNLTITGGYYDGGKGGDNRCIQVNKGATVTIKDGTFTVGGDATGLGNSVVLCNGGTVVIEGGFFYTDYAYRNFYYVLNQQNSNPGTITVKGGTFVNYNPANGDDYLGGNFVADGYTVISETKANGDVWYTVVAEKKFSTVEEAFSDVDFGYGTTSTEPVSIDGKGVTVIEKWADSYFNSDTIIKGVTFKNGASFTAKNSNITVTLENCTFYACDQDATVAALGITDKTTGAGNNGRNNIATNTGAGMCLNLEQENGTSGVKLIVKNCTFIGENNKELPVYGDKYDNSGKVTDSYKKRGHAIALNAISGGGTAGVLDSMLIDGCVIDGVRGNAIQLYGKTGDITVKNTKINSWGINNGAYTVNGTVKDANSAAIRGDFPVGGERSLTISNVYFGMDEDTVTDSLHKINHVNVGAFSGNTDGTRKAGTY